MAILEFAGNIMKIMPYQREMGCKYATFAHAVASAEHLYD